MSTELDKMALMLIAMDNARKMRAYAEPAHPRVAVPSRRRQVRIRIGNALIHAGHRLKNTKQASAATA